MHPVQASNFAPKVDALYFYITGVSVFFTVIIAIVLIIFAIKYRRRPGNEVGTQIHGSLPLEIAWTGIPAVLAFVMFFWGAYLAFEMEKAPANAMDVAVTGKKWMWKFMHGNGKKEINTLHLPVNTPVKLTMASEDVIHNVWIPAFRVKHDVVPGRLSTMWFEPTRTGTYHLFCNQYCGRDHSRMVGSVVVLEQADYQKWLAGNAGEAPAVSGEKLFQQFACNTCHMSGDGQRGPSLNGIFGMEQELMGGGKVIATEDYLRESILKPQEKIVKGYQPIMPSYQGLITEDQLLQLVAYIKTLKADATAPAPKTN
jgi:cytochrome c oxidase subunit 2